ncbi:MAG TPA: peptidyl-prolyl cis-trans isomerase [Gemmatimonadales bacterium]|jgi:peptidyl-prolyl cis-trans isomerase D
MMQFFRSVGGKIAAFVFALLMFIFVVTSVDWSQITGGSRSTVGVINGVSIPVNAYQAILQQAIDARQRQSGASLSADDIEEVRNQVWENLIQEQVMSSEFKRRHISADAEEIAEAIKNSPPQELMNVPEFQTEGKFDLAKYQRWLGSSIGRQYIPQLEAQYREEIMRGKLLRVVTADVYLSDAALWQSYRDAHETVTMQLSAVIPRDVVPDSTVSLTEAEVKKYYDDHLDQFKQPTTAFLSYVQISRLPVASDSAAALARAEEVRKEIHDGAPFAEVAKRESADTVSGAKGGDLGEFKKGQMDPAFEKAAFSLPLGTLSNPVLSSFGYHIIQIDSRSGDKAKGRHILIPIEITGDHRDHLDAQADSLESLGAERLDPAALDTVSRVMGLKIGRANPTQIGSKVMIGMQVIPEASVWAFKAKQGETSRVIELSYAYMLFRLDSLHAERVPPLDQIHGAVEIAARNAKKPEMAKSVVNDMSKRLSEGSTLEQAAKALHLPFQQFPPFSRVNPPFPSAILVGAAFGVDTGKVAGPIETDEGTYFLKVLKRVKADSAAYVADLNNFKIQQVRLARQDRVRSYLAALRENAKVDDRRARIFTTDAQAEAAQAAQAAQTGKKL